MEYYYYRFKTLKNPQVTDFVDNGNRETTYVAGSNVMYYTNTIYILYGGPYKTAPKVQHR